MPEGSENSKGQANGHPGITYAHQPLLQKLPIPELEDSCRKYLNAVRPLQTVKEHEKTVLAVKQFLTSDGPDLQERLKKYAATKASYIEQFCKYVFGA